MADTTRVVIGIQARSGSTRFPNKVMERLGDKGVLDHVIDRCKNATRYVNRYIAEKQTEVIPAVCIPAGDPLRLSISIPCVEGPEQDVLTRYCLLAKQLKADYIVRITSDCPLIPPFVISKHITLAVANHYDYVSNVDEKCRTAPDGFDCEVISARALDYADLHAKDPTDREHVTLYLRKYPPDWIRHAATVNCLNLSHLKLSLDTPEDLKRITEAYESAENAYQAACGIFGKYRVHRI